MLNINRLPLAALGVGVALLLNACSSTNSGHTAGQPNRRDAIFPTRDGRHSQYVAGNDVGGAVGSEYSVPTGSRIPRRTTRTGYTDDNQDPRFIYDQNDIRLQSTENVSDSLRTVPGITVPGPR